MHRTRLAVAGDEPGQLVPGFERKNTAGRRRDGGISGGEHGRRAYYLGKPNGYMFHRARRKLAGVALNDSDQVVMIGDTMETDIRGAFEAGIQSYLVLSGSTQFESVGDYVYQPTRILQNVGDLVEEVKTGRASDRLNSPAYGHTGFRAGRSGVRHQTDIFAFQKPRPRPAMTK